MDQKNVLIAIVLSAIVLIVWQYFVGMPQMEKQRQEAQQQAQQRAQQQQPQQGQPIPTPDGRPQPQAPGTTPILPGQGGAPTPGAQMTREAVIAATPRIRIETPRLNGSISLKGGRIDDLALIKYREKVDPNSPPIVLLSPSGSPHPFYSEFGWVGAAGANLNLPGQETMWRHEGLIGVMGDQGLQEITYSKVEEKKAIPFNVTNAWFGITDKYWAATLLPDTKMPIQANFNFSTQGAVKTYQTDYLGPPQTVAPGATGATSTRLFAGAKEVATVDGYDKQLGLNRFELLIDWGWFYFITKPMFWAIDYLFKLVGNFGVAILLVTLIIKIVFFPLSNKSYASMAKMKAVQPQMLAIRDRYADDKMKQQQELMELYRKEKINPLAGCLPILPQVPVFFALYKVLFITIEMRHAPFYGWIKDLSAPDPTTIFNLFGLLPWDPSIIPVLGPYMMIGAWPIIMGFTMFVQMKLNPPPPDPTQKMIFDWMPLIFTFMLAGFSAGLVIYWAWNNTLSVLQQAFIMRRHGVKVELFDNLRSL